MGERNVGKRIEWEAGMMKLSPTYYLSTYLHAGEKYFLFATGHRVPQSWG
jgi:hypothetical protein